MVKYKNIRIPKRGGGSRLQRVQVLASGKYKFVKNPKSKSRSTRTKTTRRKSNPKRRKRTTARRKRKSRRQKFTIPLAVVGGLAAGLAGPASHVVQGDWEEGLRQLAANYTGAYPRRNGTVDWNMEYLKRGLVPLVLGIAAHKVAGMLGINRALGRAKIPLIRI